MDCRKKNKNKKMARSYSVPDMTGGIEIPESKRFERSTSGHNIGSLDMSLDEATLMCPDALIVSGGGGAFMHPTHVPFSKPILVDDVVYDRVAQYPPLRESKKYALLNIFGFRRRNLQFDMLGISVH